MNGIPTALIRAGKQNLCHHVEERRGEKTSYFNHIMRSLMMATKHGINRKRIYYSGENFALSLLTEICTYFGIMEFSLTATMSSH